MCPDRSSSWRSRRPRVLPADRRGSRYCSTRWGCARRRSDAGVVGAGQASVAPEMSSRRHPRVLLGEQGPEIEPGEQFAFAPDAQGHGAAGVRWRNRGRRGMLRASPLGGRNPRPARRPWPGEQRGPRRRDAFGALDGGGSRRLDEVCARYRSFARRGEPRPKPSRPDYLSHAGRLVEALGPDAARKADGRGPRRCRRGQGGRCADRARELIGAPRRAGPAAAADAG